MNKQVPKQSRKLIEVALPLEAINKASAREKSIRHGHPSTLHLWWARRPLASSRAVLLGLLWPGPGDRLGPGGCNGEGQGRVGSRKEDRRKALLKFVAGFANWDLAANRGYLDVSRALVKAAHGE